MAKNSKNRKNLAAEPVPENMAQLVLEEGRKIAKEDFGIFFA